MTPEQAVNELRRIQDIWGKQEDLHGDLLPYLSRVPGLGEAIRHPLVFSVPHHEMMNSIINRQYIAKKAAALEAFRTKNYVTYIYLHERPYRVRAFMNLIDYMNDADYWKYLGQIWTDSENINQERLNWIRLWESDRSDRHLVMSEEERATLEGLPDRITIYRGVSTRKGLQGLSWTIDRGRAVWFGRRFASFDSRSIFYVGEAEVEKRHVLAFFDREDEIVVFPKNCRNIRSKRENVPTR